MTGTPRLAITPVDPRATDARLLDVARGGGEDGRRAFGHLVRTYHARVVQLTTRLLAGGAGVEDVAQESFLRAYLALERYPMGVPFWPWIKTIATRLAFNHRRDARTRIRHENRAEPSRSPSSPGLADREVVEKVLDQLPSPQREILTLRHVDELSLKEIVAELDLGSSAAKMRLSRARKGFRAAYDQLVGRV